MAPTSRRSPAEVAAELKRLQETTSDNRDRLSLIHEISVYQEELMVQNEALLHAQSTLEETRDRFIELYDFAPTGYLTLDNHGIILQCNLTAAALLGRRKDAIEGLPLWGFVLPEERTKYGALLHQCRSQTNGRDIESELTFGTPDGPRVCQLLCRPRKAVVDRHEFFTSMVDVTERRMVERERTRIAREHAALAARLIEVQDEERQRIARNLHDDIGQQHTAIRLTLERLLQHLPDEPSRQLIGDLRQMFSRLDQRVHFVATELRPSALDLGLVRATDQFVREWAETFHIEVSFLSHVPAYVRFPAEVETQLYRITQEALNNVAKYAHARNVSVVIDLRDDDLVLIVEDDGCGFDLASATTPGRAAFGLVGMRERAQIIGGRLRVETAPGHGTSVFAHVPVPLKADRR
jgi:PAS domain S-box-containing protein